MSSVVKFLNSCKDRNGANPLPLLKRIATAVVLIPIVLALILRAPVPVLAVVAAAVALLTIYEFLKLTESYGVQPLRWPTYIFTGIFFLLLHEAKSHLGRFVSGRDNRVRHRRAAGRHDDPRYPGEALLRRELGPRKSPGSLLVLLG